MLNKNSTICLIEDEKAIETIKMEIIGGRSIVFNRYHQVEETIINTPFYNNSQWFVSETGKLVYQFQGHNANTIYQFCLMHAQLCGKLLYHAYNNDNISKLFGITIVDIEVPPE